MTKNHAAYGNLNEAFCKVMQARELVMGASGKVSLSNAGYEEAIEIENELKETAKKLFDLVSEGIAGVYEKH